MKKVLIICHAGKLIGLGHLSRSLLIANMIKKKFNFDIELIIQGDKYDNKNLRNFKHSFISLDQNLVNFITNKDIDLILFDILPKYLPPYFLKTLSSISLSRVKKISIDCLKESCSLLDLVFIPSYKLENDVKFKTSLKCKFVYGWDSYILEQNVNIKDWVPGRNVIVLSGGSDSYNLGSFWPKSLDNKLSKNISINWITGPYSSRPEFPNPTKTKLKETIAPEKLSKIMQKSNYAITVFGVSFFELIYLGVPTVVFSPNMDRDAKELKEIKKLGIALVAENIDQANSMLVELMNNNALATKLSKQSRKQINISGLDRLNFEIASLFN